MTRLLGDTGDRNPEGQLSAAPCFALELLTVKLDFSPNLISLSILESCKKIKELHLSSSLDPTLPSPFVPQPR